MGINAEYMGLHPETMATPEHQARIDAARKPPYEMEGAPTSTTQITSPAPATVEKYANGDQKTVADDGDITYQYQGRDVAQYSHHLGTRDGMVITYFTVSSHPCWGLQIHLCLCRMAVGSKSCRTVPS